MFFDRKMQLVWVDGDSSLLERFVQQCCIGNNLVHPTSASDKMSTAMGFAPPQLENPWGKRVEQMERLALGLDLPVVDPAFEDARSDKLDEYLSRVQAELDEKRAACSDLRQQLELCEKGKEQFEHFTQLDVDFDKTLECEYIAVRFGRLPKDSFEILLDQYGDDPYVFFIRCSEDEDNYWGIYFAPRDRKALIDGIFAGLYFERVHLPGAAGTPREIVDNLEDNIRILRKQLQQAEAELQQAWNAEKWRCAGIYASFCSLARVVELCRCAVVRGEHFFYALWIDQQAVNQFVDTCDKVGGLHIALDITLPRKKWLEQNQQ